jgi:hypothetical protein
MDKKNKAAGILPAAMDAAVGLAQDALPAACGLQARSAMMASTSICISGSASAGTGISVAAG